MKATGFAGGRSKTRLISTSSIGGAGGLDEFEFSLFSEPQ
jgi:hypothetical protein